MNLVRRVAILAIVGMQMGWVSLAHAAFPEKPITIIVPWPTGGAYDLAARLMAESTLEGIDVPVVVNNVTGAAGSTGVRSMARASADGYTLGVMGTHAIAQSYMNPNATSLADLDPLVFIGPEPASLAVNSSTGINNVEAYLETLRKAPGSIANGNDSPGGFSFIAATMLENHFKVKMTKIPYQGYAPTVSALVSDEVMSATLPIPLLAEQHKAGEVKIIGVAAQERHPYTPDVPTFKELGYDLIAEDFYMLVIPKGVPQEHKEVLEKAFHGLLSSDDFQDKAGSLGLVIRPLGTTDTQAYLERRDAEVRGILEQAGLLNR